MIDVKVAKMVAESNSEVKVFDDWWERHKGEKHMTLTAWATNEAWILKGKGVETVWKRQWGAK